MQEVPGYHALLFIGEHVLSPCNVIYTPDGKTHDLGLKSCWTSLVPTTNGLLASKLERPGNDQILVFTRTPH